MAMEGPSNCQEESTSSSKKDITEQIQRQMKRLGKYRKIYPAKCSDLLHQSLKVQFKAMNAATVNVKLPVAHLERQKANHRSEGKAVLPVSLNLDKSITPSNAPSAAERDTCGSQLGELMTDMEDLQTVLSQVKSEEESAVCRQLYSK